tara:strand:+ start:304 stop:579 length:276 start_codon:yes stop_codon:yes gene_type:complete
MEKIGNTHLEIDADKMLECRQIVKNLINFGLSESQKLHIIYLMSLEMESRDALNIITESVKKIKSLDENTKFSLTNEDADYNEQKPKLLDI